MARLQESLNVNVRHVTVCHAVPACRISSPLNRGS